MHPNRGGISNAETYRAELGSRYEAFQARNLNLDMSRGKPCPEQLDLSMDMLTCVNESQFCGMDGTDCRNYGGIEGIPEARQLFSHYLEVDPEEVIIGGNSSLNLMHDVIMRAMIHGVVDSAVPWGQVPEVTFLCPSPGYDRHFSICEYLNIHMIPVEMRDGGPDMDVIETLVREDERIKGIWCVPKYSNPTGVTYSDDVVDRLARMKTGAPDFRIFWDNAYAVHHLNNRPDSLKNILSACKEAGHPDRVFLFGSTSKISIAGGGLSLLACSRYNMEHILKQMAFQTIGPDKINQLRHVRFFKDMEGIEAHMKKHAAILRPKFDAVYEVLERELGRKDLAEWSRPNGGYFISLNTPEGCARAVVRMAAEAGVKLTPAGATYPYKRDPLDRNIRIAPTFPGLEEIKAAMELVAICIQIVSVDRKSGSD